MFWITSNSTQQHFNHWRLKNHFCTLSKQSHPMPRLSHVGPVWQFNMHIKLVHVNFNTICNYTFMNYINIYSHNMKIFQTKLLLWKKWDKSEEPLKNPYLKNSFCTLFVSLCSEEPLKHLFIHEEPFCAEEPLKHPKEPLKNPRVLQRTLKNPYFLVCRWLIGPTL